MTHWNESAWFFFLTGAALKSTAILGIAWLATRLMAQRSAASRHMVWTAAFAGVLAMPFLSAGLPAWQVPGASAFLLSPSDPVFHTSATALTSDKSGTPQTARSGVSSTPALTKITPNWRLAALLTWATGASLMLAQMLLACLRLTRQRRTSPSLPYEDDAGAASRHTEMRESPQGSMPMAFGVFRPVVFLPATARAWDSERRRMVLAHELGHIQRHDNTTHLMARTALSLMWWNPLAWTAWSEFLKERERAADDLVLRGGARASEYASHLLDIARSVRSEPRGALAAVAMARPAQLETRLLAILDSAVNRRAPGRAAMWLAGIAALAVTLPLAAVQAQDPQQQLPPDVEATIRAALSQKNHQILDNAAAAFLKTQQYDVARKLDEAALEVRASVSGTNSASYAEGLMQLGDLEIARGHFKEATDYYEKAVALGDRPEVARALTSLGINALGHGDRDTALNYLQRGMNLASTPNESSRSLMWLAKAYQMDPARSAEAESRYQSAISLAEPGSAQQAAALELYDKFLAQQNRSAEAEEIHKRAGQARKGLIESYVRDAAPVVSNNAAVRVGNGVTMPKPTFMPEPEYTELARQAKHSGEVVLYIEVDPNGTVRNPKVVKGLGFGLDEKAIEAVLRWKFQPGTKDGKPVTVSAQVQVNFKLL